MLVYIHIYISHSFLISSDHYMSSKILEVLYCISKCSVAVTSASKANWVNKVILCNQNKIKMHSVVWMTSEESLSALYMTFKLHISYLAINALYMYCHIQPILLGFWQL